MKNCEYFCTQLDKVVKVGNFVPDLFYYKNQMLRSNKFSDIEAFFDSFLNTESLVQWMRLRPKNKPNIYEVEGNKKIVVVIPTLNFDGPMAVNCRKSVFKGLHIIFVGGEKHPDPLFSFPQYVNVGFKKAIEYNPDWIIYSGDDVYMIDDPMVLINSLRGLDPDKIDAVYTKPSTYHSVPSRLSKESIIRKVISSLLPNFRKIGVRRKVEKKYCVEYFPVRNNELGGKLLFSSKGMRFIEFLDFGILSGNYVRRARGEVFDETFYFGAEDHELSIRMSGNSQRYSIIDYKIGDYIGGTLGVSINRDFRLVSGLIYLNYKIRSGKLAIYTSNDSRKVSELR